MTEELDGVLLTDGRSRILLHPPEPYPGGHGFHHQVDLVGGPFQGVIDALSYEGPIALRSFHQQLVEPYQNLIGEVCLPNCYENLRLSLKGDGLGHVTVHTDVAAGDLMDVRLTFNFAIDQTPLPKIIADVKRLFL